MKPTKPKWTKKELAKWTFKGTPGQCVFITVRDGKIVEYKEKDTSGKNPRK